MAGRKDEHRPSVINPDDYEYVGQEFIKVESLGDCEAQRLMREEITRHMTRTGGKYSHHEHGGQCGVCGSVNAIYTVLFYHEKTNTYIRMGQDCAEKCGLEDAAAFRSFRDAIKDARTLHAGKTKAKALLEDRGISAAWAVYAAPAGEGREEATIHDIVGKLVKYGSASDAQFDFLAKLLERIATRPEREAKQAAETAAAKPVPLGRFEIVGTILTVKVQESQFGEVVKMLVKHADGWKIWGTVPSSLGTVNRGDKVKFTATVEASKDDPKFGFFKRPTKAEVLEPAPESAK